MHVDGLPYLSGNPSNFSSFYHPSNNTTSQATTFHEVEPPEDDFYDLSPSLTCLQKYFSYQKPIPALPPIFSFSDACWQPPENL
jgi:hypothetical protein